MVTALGPPTGYVVTKKLGVVGPAGTVTVAGGVAANALLVVKFTTAPPLGAGADRVTVPVEKTTPGTLFGFRATELTVCPASKVFPSATTLSNPKRRLTLMLVL